MLPSSHRLTLHLISRKRAFFHLLPAGGRRFCRLPRPQYLRNSCISLGADCPLACLYFVAHSRGNTLPSHQLLILIYQHGAASAAPAYCMAYALTCSMPLLSLLASSLLARDMPLGGVFIFLFFLSLSFAPCHFSTSSRTIYADQLPGAFWRVHMPVYTYLCTLLTLLYNEVGRQANGAVIGSGKNMNDAFLIAAAGVGGKTW